MTDRVRGQIIVTDQGNYTFWDEWVLSDMKCEIFSYVDKRTGDEFIVAFNKRTKKPVHQKNISELSGAFIDKVCGFNDELRALMARR